MGSLGPERDRGRATPWIPDSCSKQIKFQPRLTCSLPLSVLTTG